MVIPTMTFELWAPHELGNIDASMTLSLANTAGIRVSQRPMPDTREQFDCSSPADIQAGLHHAITDQKHVCQTRGEPTREPARPRTLSSSLGDVR